MFNTNVQTTGNFNFAPTGAEFVLEAFQRCQIKPATLTAEHMANARMALNMLLAEWSNRQPNLWVVGLQSLPLTQGVASYAMPASTVMILDLYISTSDIDRYLSPISRTDYSSYADKTTQASPTVYWYDRLISQTVTFYPVPDGNGPYVANFYSVRQNQDTDVQNGTSPEIPYRFYDAYAAGVAWKLAEKYAPHMEEKLLARYERAWEIAATQDTENVPLYITPGLGSYMR